MAYHPTPILVITASLAPQRRRYQPDACWPPGALDVIEKPSRRDPATWDRRCRNAGPARSRHSPACAWSRTSRAGAHRPPRRHRRPPPDGAAASAPAAPQTPPAAQRAATRPPPARASGRRPSHRMAAPRRQAGIGAEPAAPPALPRRSRPRRYELVVIASSTGGPQACSKFCAGCPATSTHRSSLCSISRPASPRAWPTGWAARRRGPVRLAAAGERPGPARPAGPRRPPYAAGA